MTDSLGDNGNRHWNSLWFFSHRCVMEVKAFEIGTADDLDFMGVTDGIFYCQVIKTQYTPGTAATVNSRLKVSVRYIEHMGGIMEATGMNCDQLWMWCTHILPHVLRGERS